jgi:predicted membrane protein
LNHTEVTEKNDNIKIRLVVYLIGLFIMTLGISMSVKSNLGVSPVSSIPYTITCITGLEMGKAAILFHIVLVALQFVILRGAFQIKSLLRLC